jgi:adenosyl cobinamide kinase/adenosyl cobinamide phosphate guanylyltransferase
MAAWRWQATVTQRILRTQSRHDQQQKGVAANDEATQEKSAVAVVERTGVMVTHCLEHGDTQHSQHQQHEREWEKSNAAVTQTAPLESMLVAQVMVEVAVDSMQNQQCQRRDGMAVAVVRRDVEAEVALTVRWVGTVTRRPDPAVAAAPPAASAE